MNLSTIAIYLYVSIYVLTGINQAKRIEYNLLTPYDKFSTLTLLHPSYHALKPINHDHCPSPRPTSQWMNLMDVVMSYSDIIQEVLGVWLLVRAIDRISFSSNSRVHNECTTQSPHKSLGVLQCFLHAMHSCRAPIYLFDCWKKIKIRYSVVGQELRRDL